MHERISVNGICFPGATFSQQAEYWRELGAHRVSLTGHQLQAEGVAAAKAALSTGKYKVETVPHVFMATGSLERNEKAWSEARDGLNRVIDDAKAVGARSIYMVTGGRGTLTWEDAAACFSEAVAPCAAKAKTAGIQLAIEPAPALYANIHIAHTLRDTVTLAEMAGIGVCIDFYPIWTEAGLRESIKRAVPRSPVAQLCDYVYGDKTTPARAVVGDGAIPVKRMIGWLLEAGYTGPFDLELLGPRIDQEGHFAATRRTCDNLSEILNSLGV